MHTGISTKWLTPPQAISRPCVAIIKAISMYWQLGKLQKRTPTICSFFRFALIAMRCLNCFLYFVTFILPPLFCSSVLHTVFFFFCHNYNSSASRSIHLMFSIILELIRYFKKLNLLQLTHR